MTIVDFQEGLRDEDKTIQEDEEEFLILSKLQCVDCIKQRVRHHVCLCAQVFFVPKGGEQSTWWKLRLSSFSVNNFVGANSAYCFMARKLVSCFSTQIVLC